MKNNSLLFLLAVALLSLTAFKTTHKFFTQFFDYHNFPTEKVYLHLDKSHYALGERLWFKAYLQTENHVQLDSMSKVLYVELIKPDNQVAKRLTLKINEGSTKGDFALADSLESGNYRLRAYTNYMRNFENYFEQTIAVINPQISEKVAENDLKTTDKVDSFTSVQNQYSFQFFPEGGDLVENLPSMLAFKATLSNGKAIKAKGEVFDNEGIKVAIFESNEVGTGKFRLSALPNRSYTAKVRYETGEEKSYALPKAQAKGMVLNIDNSDQEKVKLRILKNISSKITVVAQQYGKVYATLQDASDKNVIVTEIERSKFPQGIVHFTLFDEKNIPHAERLVWANHYKTLDLELKTDKNEYQKREKVNIDLAIDEAEGDFSIAVTDAKSVQAQEQDILTYSLLTSELKGRIENPSYYFEKTEASEKALDNLLLTQGWRRFTWKQLLNNEKPSFAYQIEHGIGMSGTAKDEFGKMVKNKSISLFNVKTNFLATSSVDKNGYFEILDMDIQDSLEVMVRVEKEKNVRLKINEPISPILTSPVTFLDYPKVNTNFLTNSKQASKAEEEFRAESDVRVLKEVTVKDTKIEPEYVPPVWKLHGEADFVIDGKKLERNAMSYQHIVWGLQGQIPGLVILAPDQIGAPPIVSLGRGGGSPIFLLDGVIVGINFLSGINPNDIASVELLRGANAAIYGSRASGGVVAFYTKMGPDKDNSKYIAKKTIQGYYTAQEFYSPNYENPTETEKLKPDFRTTLYWNPSVKIDTKGKASLSFFCADVPTKYRIVVEGRSKNGTLGRKEIFVEVKK
jgi:hypothetical protein